MNIGEPQEIITITPEEIPDHVPDEPIPESDPIEEPARPIPTKEPIPV